jgi:hypothetical protein
MYLAEGHTALGTTAGLLARTLPGEFAVDFIEIMGALRRQTLVGHFSRLVGKLEHFLRHSVILGYYGAAVNEKVTIFFPGIARLGRMHGAHSLPAGNGGIRL